MLLMAGAFAGRGIGSCALSPLRTSATNQGVVESRTIAAKLTAGTPSLTDDGASSDHDGSLEPGESGLLRLTVANGGVLAAEQLTVTAASSNPGVRLVVPRPLALLPEFSMTTLTIPVSVLSSVPRGTSVTITLHVGAEDTCDRAGITLTLTIQIGAAGVASPSERRIATSAAPEQAGVVAGAPATSLRAFDAGVCLAEQAP